MTKEERNLLLAVFAVCSQYRAPTSDTLARFAAYYSGQTAAHETEVEDSLIRRKLLGRGPRGVYLTETGLAVGAAVYQAEMFSGQYLACERSQAYATYCERLYGGNLVQFNMADMAQIQKLIQVLKLESKHRVLDLGCGIGTVTEAISDQTRAHVTGIDTAIRAIERATERTVDKRDRLTFAEGDMNELSLPSGSFDRILAIDTLYFVRDLPQVLRNLKGLLAPGGQMGIFWIELGTGDGKVSERSTRLAVALEEAGLVFDAWDFSPSLRQHFVDSLSILQDLQPQFEQEGSLVLHASRRDESEEHLREVDTHGAVRSLYRVTLELEG